MKLAVATLTFPNENTWESQFSLQLVQALSQVGHEVSVLTTAHATTVASLDIPRVEVFKVFQKKILSDGQRLIETLTRSRPEKLILVIDKTFDLKWSGIFITLFATAQAINCHVYVIAHNDVIRSKIDELKLSPLLSQAKRVFSAHPSKNYPWKEINTSLVGLQNLTKVATPALERSQNVFVFGQLKKRPQHIHHIVGKISEIESLEKIYLALSPDAESLFKHLVITELQALNLHSKIEFVSGLDFETCENFLVKSGHLFLLDNLSTTAQIPWIVGMAIARGLKVSQCPEASMTVDQMTNLILREIVGG